MSGLISHFAINADDVDTARRFYESIFGWRCVAWGPPGFYKIENDAHDVARTETILGALQQRRELAPGQRITGFECTVAVADVDEVARRAVAGGGRVLMDKTTIAGVGDLVWIEDPSGNVVGAMRYDTAAGS